MTPKRTGKDTGAGILIDADSPAPAAYPTFLAQDRVCTGAITNGKDALAARGG